MRYIYVTDTNFAVSLMWLSLCQGTLLAKYTLIYPVPRRCIRQFKSGPQSIILSTVTVTVSWGSSNKVIFSIGQAVLGSEWNSTICPMKINHSDNAKASRRLLKLKKSTGICNYIQELDNVPFKSTVMYIWLIMKSVLIWQNWQIDNCSSVFTAILHWDMLAFAVLFLSMEEYHICIEPKKHICLSCITNLLMFGNVK